LLDFPASTRWMASYLSEAARMTASVALVSPILLLKSVAPFPGRGLPTRADQRSLREVFGGRTASGGQNFAGFPGEHPLDGLLLKQGCENDGLRRLGFTHPSPQVCGTLSRRQNKLVWPDQACPRQSRPIQAKTGLSAPKQAYLAETTLFSGKRPYLAENNLIRA
jgi:hypothetical protein